ncbi:ead/Ea22-like family protein [Klebsiella quasipneumoniae]|uniref:ead/Ea22-like family protein n=1 Tax=Klebsiella quasipneumoniae TaxID=1463165 RepID=UPI0010EDDDD8|nr:ead/Ea22-like family protein [Klebsiella quasipneumoniae]UDC53390.1 ead/Ea22-like family protein [Klebsiella quasipneumoniae subsp. quasipneumoniae]VGP60072.1 hypothetical protein SB02110_05299 [Klebsiella quasipneumoniae subsp. quasipneumoniae]
MSDITELAQRMRIAATMASQGAWSYARSGFNSIVQTSANLPSGGASRVVLCKLFRSEWRGELKTAQDAQFIALANPANVRALVEALEKAQGMEAYWKTQCRGITDHCEELQARIAELESRTVKLPAERFCPAEYAGSQLWSETEVWNKAITACADALRAGGIKVETE